MEKRNYIVSEAARMFDSQGIKSVRIDDIAAQVGMSKRTLYEMFGSKDELLKESMYLLFVESFKAEWDSNIPDNDVVSNIFMILRNFVREKSAQREHNERMRNNLRKFYPEVARYIESELHKEGHARVSVFFEKGIREGIFKSDIRVDLSMFMLAGSLFMLGQGKIPMFDNISVEDAFEYMVINFFRGISTIGGVEKIDRSYALYKASVNEN